MADMDHSLTVPIDDGEVQSAAASFSSVDDLSHIISAELALAGLFPDWHAGLLDLQDVDPAAARVFRQAAGGDDQVEGNSNSGAVSVFQMEPESGLLAEEIVQRHDYLEPTSALYFETVIARALGRGAYGGGGVVVPASNAVVAGLEKRAFHAAATEKGRRDSECGGGGDTGCTICLVDYQDGEEVTVMPCSGGHEFHTGCITKWLGKSNTCPLCRHALPKSMDDVDD